MKILCLGNNTEDTDVQTRKLAHNHGLECHGLLSDLDGVVNDSNIDKPGYYHSSVFDIEYGKLLELGKQFSQVIVLNQLKEQYSHPNAYYETIVVAQQLQTVTDVVFLNAAGDSDIKFFKNLVNINKSFCIFPFIELLTNMRDDGYTTVCCRSNIPIANANNIVDFQTDPNYQVIRDAMLQGQQLEHCTYCYREENLGILSARQQETVEWANRLDIKSLKDLDTIKYPAYYEIRPSTVCNLQCRMCGPNNSNRIAREYKKLKLIDRLPEVKKTDFSLVRFENLKKLYVAGGEPMAMPEFYDFLDRCIKNQKTDFELVVNTNGTKLSQRFRQQLTHFNNFQFTFSIDATDDLSYYLRWPSDWQNIFENIRYIHQQGHSMSFNTTVSIYNVLNLHQLLKFFDDNFPKIHVHLGLCQYTDDILSPMRFPYSEPVLTNLLTIRQLKCYQNDLMLQTFVEALIQNYQKNPTVDQDRLKKFFDLNDRLDQSRNIKLSDYIPELEKARELIL